MGNTDQKYGFVADALRKDPDLSIKVIRNALRAKYGSGIETSKFCEIRRIIRAEMKVPARKVYGAVAAQQKLKAEKVTVQVERKGIDQVLADTAQAIYRLGYSGEISIKVNPAGTYQVAYTVVVEPVQATFEGTAKSSN